MDKTSEKIDRLTNLVNQEIEDIFKGLEGKKIKDVKRFLLNNKFGFNPTKRKIVELIEEKISIEINEQRLTKH
ncbi:hypothetical protein IGI57_002494 [Enterococcus sp. DIV0213j]|uniref:hypothetical protein n=1 Tax=Enterococcus sp. DIV0213j TaxID=2774649 RepID=UPI003D28CAE6